MKALSNRQKAVLVQLARRAYAYLKVQFPPFDEWRRREVEAACGRPGLTNCENRHYNSIAAHFESLMGRDDRALNHLIREGTERRRSQEVLLARLLRDAGLPATYAETISQARFKCAVASTNDQQFEQLLMTVKSRLRARARQNECSAAAA